MKIRRGSDTVSLDLGSFQIYDPDCVLTLRQVQANIQRRFRRYAQDMSVKSLDPPTAEIANPDAIAFDLCLLIAAGSANSGRRADRLISFRREELIQWHCVVLIHDKADGHAQLQRPLIGCEYLSDILICLLLPVELP